MQIFSPREKFDRLENENEDLPFPRLRTLIYQRASNERRLESKKSPDVTKLGNVLILRRRFFSLLPFITATIGLLCSLRTRKE